MKMMTLQSQLTRASLLTTFLVLLVCSVAVLSYEYFTARKDWAVEMRVQADLIAHNSAAALVFSDTRAAQENLAVLDLQRRIAAAALFDRDGHTFAVFRAEGEDRINSPLDPALLHAGLIVRGSTIELAQPILYEGERVGVVYLKARHNLAGRVLTYTLILFAVMATGMAIAYLFFNRLLKRVSRPLDEMRHVAQEVMSKRAWGLRARETEYQDIGVLVQAFNGMLAEVQARTSELEVEMAERVRAEQGLRQADRRKDEFLATLAHELRNPLAPMTTALALLRRESTTPAVRERSMTILQRQLAHLVRLIDDLLDVSRVSTGKLSLRAEPVDLIEILKSAVELYRESAANKAITLTFHRPAHPIMLMGDAARLWQVFSNLLGNACRYTPLGGRIEVSVNKGRQSVEVTVQDTGMGVEPSMQERIFELFEQGDKSLERGSAGLGIGLTLARQLVQLHGGEISVYSEGRDKGSRFTVSLPVPAENVHPDRDVAAGTAPASSASPAATHDEYRVSAGALLPKPVAPQASADELEQEESDLGRLSILVADDNEDFATSLCELLRVAGHSVEVVHDGAEALASALRHPPDVALLDIGMPGLNGYDLAARLRSEPALRDTLLVAITGWGQASDRERSAAAGFDRHLTKPVEPEVLHRLLTDALKSDQPLS